jgi:hypothetical protein
LALKDIWTNKTDGVDDILADDINAIADEAIESSDKIQSLQENKADKATTLEGYGITDAYTKVETNNVITNKVDKIDGFGLMSITYSGDYCMLSVRRDNEEYPREVSVYSKGYLDGELAGKVNTPSFDVTSSEHISFEFSAYYNTEMRADETRSVSFTFGNGSYELDYTSGLSFDSGNTPTAIDYTDSGILNWVGTDCVTSNGLSIFQPSPNTHYDIVFYFNGKQFIGLVNGYVPATGNEAV